MKESCGINHFIVYLFGWVSVHFVGSTAINATFWITIKSHCTLTGWEWKRGWDHRSFYYRSAAVGWQRKRVRWSATCILWQWHLLSASTSTFISSFPTRSISFHFSSHTFCCVLSLRCVIISAFTISLKPNVIVNSHQIFQVQKMMKLFCSKSFLTYSLTATSSHQLTHLFPSLSCHLCLHFESLFKLLCVKHCVCASSLCVSACVFSFASLVHEMNPHTT